VRYFVVSSLVLLGIGAILYYRHSRPRLSAVSFQDCYNVRLLETDLSKHYGFGCTEILKGECNTFEARSTFHAWMKDLWIRIWRPRGKVFEVNVFHKGPSRFSVTAEFEESRIVVIYLRSEAESLAAAEFWVRTFKEQFPDAPLDRIIRPWEDEELGKGGTRSEVQRRAQTIRLPQ
jgi:hypothetical protein